MTQWVDDPACLCEGPSQELPYAMVRPKKKKNKIKSEVDINFLMHFSVDMNGWNSCLLNGIISKWPLPGLSWKTSCIVIHFRSI